LGGRCDQGLRSQPGFLGLSKQRFGGVESAQQ
jgi:hypothetical protein